MLTITKFPADYKWRPFSYNLSSVRVIEERERERVWCTVKKIQAQKSMYQLLFIKSIEQT